MIKLSPSLLTLCFYLVALSSCGKNTSEPGMKLWYDKPAAKWVEALPVGNGSSGAMIFGRTANEILQLNEESIWAGQPNNNANPNALQALPVIRALLFEGKFAEAQAMATEQVMSNTNNGMAYQPAGNLNCRLRRRSDRRMNRCTVVRKPARPLWKKGCASTWTG